MSNKSPIFPMPEPQHFSDYGFDPQINYLQVLEEAMKHKRETTTKTTTTTTTTTATSRSIDSRHFRLQKPISKDDYSFSSRTNKAHKPKKKRWWRTALFFFKWRWAHHKNNNTNDNINDVHQARARAFRASISGPVYLTDSMSGSSTPHRSTSRPSSGPIAGTVTPPAKGDVDVPYLSLRELTMEQQQQLRQQQRISTSAMPLYLVT